MICLFLVLAAELHATPLDPHPGLPTFAECRAFHEQACREVWELHQAAVALGWPDGGGWIVQRLRAYRDEAERVQAYWGAASEARHPSFVFSAQWNAAEICRRLEADGLDVRPLAIRQLITLRD